MRRTESKTHAGNRRRVVQALRAALGAPLALARKREQNLWVFGNAIGYRDNSRYLYEWVCTHHPEIRAYWLAPQTQAEFLKARGVNVVPLGSKESRAIAAQAAVGVMSYGPNDLEPYATPGMILVQLWHGMPLKRILLDWEGDLLVSKAGWLANAISKFVRKTSLRRYDLLTATSPLMVERIAKAFGVPASRVLESGQARDDALLARRAILPDKGYILWAPTYKMGGTDAGPTSAQMARLRTILVRHKLEMKIKAHPMDTWSAEEFSGHPEITVLRPTEDLNEVLPQANIVITDYSSIIFETLLLDQTLLLYIPSVDAPQADRPLYERPEPFSPRPIAKTWDELLDSLEQVLSGNNSDWRRPEKSRYYSHTDGRACERIFEAIRQMQVS